MPVSKTNFKFSNHQEYDLDKNGEVPLINENGLNQHDENGDKRISMEGGKQEFSQMSLHVIVN